MVVMMMTAIIIMTNAVRIRRQVKPIIKLSNDLPPPAYCPFRRGLPNRGHLIGKRVRH
jgi:hypothetical protein